MGTYDGWPIVVGDTDGRGGLNGGNKTEILSYNIHSDGAFEWTEFAEFPFGGDAHRFLSYKIRHPYTLYDKSHLIWPISSLIPYESYAFKLYFIESINMHWFQWKQAL